MGRHGIVGGWGYALLLTWALTVNLTVSSRVLIAQTDPYLASVSQSTSAWQVSGFESPRRNLVVVSSNESAVHPLVVRSRVDPTNGFKAYTGGYNVTNSHYWASTAWIAVGAYIAAFAWLVLGLLLACLACCQCCPVAKPPSNRGCVAYGAVILFSLLAIGGSVLLYTGNVSADSTINSVVHTLEGAVQDTVGQVHNVTAAGDAVALIVQPSQPSLSVGITTATLGLNASAARVQERVGNSTGSVSALRDGIKWSLVGVSVFYLLLLLLSAVAIPCGWTTLLLALAVLGWVAVALTLCVCGFYITAQVVVNDSCSAMAEYNVRLGPTTLDALLPCVDLMATQTTVLQLKRTAFNAGETTQNLLSAVGQNANTNLPPTCNPFLGPPDYAANTSCPTSQITDLPKVLLRLVCPETNISTTCLQQGKIVPNNTYTTLSTYAMAVSRILTVLPEVDSLLNCTFVTATFASLVTNDCQNAESSLEITWVALIILAISMMVLSPLWLHVYRRQKESSALRFHSLEMECTNGRVERREKRNNMETA